MSLQDYVLNGPTTVVQDDDRDAVVSWDRHVRTTRRGGVDLVAAVGTEVLAPTDGVFVHVPDNGSAGNSSLFMHDTNPGWSDVFSHLSQYVVPSGTRVSLGDVIALTGKSGTRDPHLHRHLLNPQGQRENPWDHFLSIRRAAAAVIRRKDSDMITRELVRPVGQPGVYFSVNRLERYPIRTEAILGDYLFHLNQLIIAGDPFLRARGAAATQVAEVGSIESFGAITLDAEPSTLVVSDDDVDVLDQNAKGRLPDLPIDLDPVLGAIAAGDEFVIAEVRTGIVAADARRLPPG